MRRRKPLLDRRQLLVSLLGLAAGCPRTSAPLAALPSTPITLGWRWVPGMRLDYRSVVQRVNRGEVVSEAQTWTYLVRDVGTDGSAMLEGRLTGYGAGVLDEDGTVVERVAEAPATTQARLRITVDGHLTASDVPGFGEGLPHRLLALGLPVQPVRPHDEWPDRATVAPFAALMPAELKMEQHGESMLVELSRHDEALAAAISTTGELRMEGGAALHLTGVASWDASLGQLAERALTARLTPSVPDPDANPGVLEARLSRI